MAKAIKLRKRRKESEENTESKIIFQAKVRNRTIDSDAGSDRRDVSESGDYWIWTNLDIIETSEDQAEDVKEV